MRGTILIMSVLALAVALAPPAAADEPIPVTCTMVSIQNGWAEAGRDIDWWWIGDASGEPDPQEGEYLWHRGTGYWLAHGDTYCRGRWYMDIGWWMTPVPEWPPMEGTEGGLVMFDGGIRMELSHANIDGGFTITQYEGGFVWRPEDNRVIEGEASGMGYDDLLGWTISLDFYIPYYPPVGNPGSQQHTVWTGYVTPADG